MLITRVEDLTKFEGECPTIVVFSTYMDIRIPLTKKWKKIINEKEDIIKNIEPLLEKHVKRYMVNTYGGDNQIEN